MTDVEFFRRLCDKVDEHGHRLELARLPSKIVPLGHLELRVRHMANPKKPIIARSWFVPECPNQAAKSCAEQLLNPDLSD